MIASTLLRQLGPQNSYAQTPRFNILINNIAVQWPLGVEVTTNNYSEAGRYTATFAVAQDDMVNLLAMTNIPVEITVSLQGETPTSLIYGFADTIEIDAINLVCTLSGRDMAALLLDSFIQKPYENLTSSQVVGQFVQEHSAQGLKGAITTTSGLVGQFYGLDYNLTRFQDLYHPTNEWSMALMLAQGEGFDLRIGGPTASGQKLDTKTLYFGPPVASENVIFNIVVDYGPPIQSNAEKIGISRSLTLAKDVKVTVVNWNSLEMRPIIAHSQSSNVNAPKGGFGPVQNYTFRMPGNATPAQAQAYAQAKLKEVTAFERVVELMVPGELELTPSNPVRLSGTGSTADQLYFVDEIVRTLSFSSGFKETIRLKNHSPYNVVSVT